MKDITVFLTEQLQAEETPLNESKVESEKDFRDFAVKMCKEAHGDDFDEDKCKETIDKFLEDNKDLVDEDKWAEVVGKWEAGFAKKD
jgi:hypothetical protein